MSLLKRFKSSVKPVAIRLLWPVLFRLVFLGKLRSDGVSEEILVRIFFKNIVDDGVDVLGCLEA